MIPSKKSLTGLPAALLIAAGGLLLPYLLLGSVSARAASSKCRTGETPPSGSYRLVKVDAEGSGIAARNAALEKAVGQVCQALVGKEETAIGERILPNASDFAVITDFPATGTAPTFSVNVYLTDPPPGKKGLLAALAAQNVLPQVKSVKIVVAYAETLENLGSGKVVAENPSPAQAAIESVLKERGFRLLSLGAVTRNVNATALRAALDGNASAADLRELRQHTGFDILAVVETPKISLRYTPQLDVTRTTARITARLIDLTRGTVLFSGTTTGESTKSGQDSDGTAAEEKAGEKLAPRVADGLLTALVTKPAPVILEVSGLGKRKDEFLDVLEKVPGVLSVVSNEFAGGILFVEADTESRLRGRLGRAILACPELRPFDFQIKKESGSDLNLASHP